MGIWGVSLPEEIVQEGLDEGIWVKEIDIDSPAMSAGVQPGDVITEINSTKISNMDEYRNALLKCAQKEAVELQGFRKGADDSYVEMEFKAVVGKK